MKKIRFVLALLLSLLVICVSMLSTMVTAGAVQVVYGDANGDNVVDLKDVVAIRRFLVGGWGVTIDSTNADVNMDNSVDLKDAVLIRRYLAGGWNVTLGPTVSTWTVTFTDYDGTIIKTQQVNNGESATPPANPTRSGYTFSGWSVSFTNVVSDIQVIATYVENSSPTLCVNNANANAGATEVIMRVSLRNNPGFLTMALNIAFDSNALTLTKVSTGADYTDYSFTAPRNKISGCTAAWFAADLPEEIVDGDILTLKFAVKEDAAQGNYPVTISCPDDGSTVDGNKTAFNMSAAVGYIVVE